jgi:hypothetical protein
MNYTPKWPTGPRQAAGTQGRFLLDKSSADDRCSMTDGREKSAETSTSPDSDLRFSVIGHPASVIYSVPDDRWPRKIGRNFHFPRF